MVTYGYGFSGKAISLRSFIEATYATNTSAHSAAGAFVGPFAIDADNFYITLFEFWKSGQQQKRFLVDVFGMCVVVSFWLKKLTASLLLLWLRNLCLLLGWQIHLNLS